jgi:hypothetical protein
MDDSPEQIVIPTRGLDTLLETRTQYLRFFFNLNMNEIECRMIVARCCSLVTDQG